MTVNKLHKLLEHIIKAGHGDKPVVIVSSEWGDQALGEAYTVRECNEYSFFGPTALTGRQVVVLG